MLLVIWVLISHVVKNGQESEAQLVANAGRCSPGVASELAGWRQSVVVLSSFSIQVHCQESPMAAR